MERELETPMTFVSAGTWEGVHEIHSVSDGGAFAAVSDDEASIIIHDPKNARSVARWLLRWAAAVDQDASGHDAGDEA